MFDCRKIPESLALMVYMTMVNQKKFKTGLHWGQSFLCHPIIFQVNLFLIRAEGMNSLKNNHFCLVLKSSNEGESC